jgi:hypothetical protein
MHLDTNVGEPGQSCPPIPTALSTPLKREKERKTALERKTVPSSSAMTVRGSPPPTEQEGEKPEPETTAEDLARFAEWSRSRDKVLRRIGAMALADLTAHGKGPEALFLAEDLGATGTTFPDGVNCTKPDGHTSRSNHDTEHKSD